MDLQKRASEYFKNHFSIHTFHFTSDGMAFQRKSDAEAHARTLTNKEVKTILRADVEIAEEEVAANSSTATDGQPDAHEGTEDTKSAPEDNANKTKAAGKKATAAAK